MASKFQKMQEYVDHQPPMYISPVKLGKLVISYLEDQEGEIVDLKELLDSIMDDVIVDKIIGGNKISPVVGIITAIANSTLDRLSKEDKNIVEILLSQPLAMELLKVAAMGYLLGLYVQSKGLAIKHETLTQEEAREIVQEIKEAVL